MVRHKSPAADELRRWMERAGKSHEDVGQALDVTHGHVRHLVTGGRTPSLALAVRIAALTGIPVTAWSREQVKAS